MKRAILVAVIALMIACKDKSEPAPAPAKPEQPHPVPGDAAGAPAERSRRLIAELTTKSGKRQIFNYRAAVPAGITPSEFGSRVTVRCRYPDAGDGTRFPTNEQLNQLQDLEERLESPSVILLGSKTGDGAREMNFQAMRSDELVALVPGAAAHAGFDCSSEVAADSDWSRWRETIEFLDDGKEAAGPSDR